jgi:hypothetical protein
MKFVLPIFALLCGAASGYVRSLSRAVLHARKVGISINGQRLHAEKKYTIPDQQLRFANAKKENDPRVLDVDSVYKPEFVKGKTVLVTGTQASLYLCMSASTYNVPRQNI